MLRFLTAGESHGKALVAIVDGMPAGLRIDEEYIARDLRRRQAGYGRGARMKIEQDHAEILSGVRFGLTLGSPIALLIQNRDWENWKEAMSVSHTETKAEPVTRVRPGHADLPGALKYHQEQDVRAILERASARETAARVAAGAVARRFLEEFGVQVHSHTVAIGGVHARPVHDIDWVALESSPVRTADAEAEKKMIKVIEAAKTAGDTLGGLFEVEATSVPIGLGSHVQWDRKLSTRIAAAIMSINAVRMVEIGSGLAAAQMPGSQFHDVLQPGKTWKHVSNSAGGIEGGMSNGEPIVVSAAIKPIPTLANPLPSVDIRTGERVAAHQERSDVCVVPAAGVVAEAMLALVLAEAFLEKFGGDHVDETRRNLEAYVKGIGG